MNKLDIFTSTLDDDLAWRKKEVSNLLLLHTNDNDLLIVKAALLLIYSHWEGFIKNSCKSYLAYIAEKSIKLNDLTLNFEAIQIKGKIKEVISASDSLNMTAELNFLDFIYDNGDKKFTLPSNFTKKEKDKNIINTKDNLNVDVLFSLLKIIGLGERKCIELKNKYISEKLLDSRNKIAHGNKIQSFNHDFNQSIEDIKKTKDILFILMDSISEDLQYYAENEFFLYKKNSLASEYNEKSNNKLEALLKEVDDE